MISNKKIHEYLLWILFIIGLFIIPLFHLAGFINIGTVNMLGRYMAFAIAALALDLIWGYCGVLSLCHALFFTIGGYAMGMYLAHHGGPEGVVDANGWKFPACLYVVFPYEIGQSPDEALVPWFWKPFYYFPITLLLGIVLPGALALIIGYFGFKSRVKGVYFAILTQALTVAFWLVFCMNNMKLCGTNGLTRFDKILGYSISSSNTKLVLYLITLIVLIVAYQSLTALINTRFGRLLIAINDDENNLRFYGYKPYVFKLFVFTISGIVAGLGGMLYVPQMGIITPEYMTAKWSIMIVIWVAIGGRGTLSGAILGALGVNLIYNYLTSNAPELWPLLQGSLFIIVVLLFPKGFTGLLDVIPLRNFNRNPKIN